jgi:cytochrome c oxidase subunit 2
LLAIVMFLVAGAITVAVLALALYAARAPHGRLSLEAGMRLVLWLGGIVPTVVLAALLSASLPMMRARTAELPELTIDVTGEQFWWRVRYPVGNADDAFVETANEIRVPVGRVVAFRLKSPDVIHSFWIPGLAGKMDMIPGRTNELVARATRAGEFRGACAEFCGLSHAHMAFDVIAMESAAFDDWLAAAAEPAAPTEHPGRALFADYGCTACHVVRGHFESSGIGPDLTHFARRTSFAAGMLPLEQTVLERFVVRSSALKPGSRMPAFADMPADDVAELAAYLLALR